MGHVILPTGVTVWVEELSGSVNLSQLINDMRCEDYTPSYRISIIAALGKLGKNADSALSYLKELGTSKQCSKTSELLSEAASHAIKKIEDGKTSNATVPHDNHYSRANRHNNWVGGYSHGGGITYGKKPEVQKVTFTEIEANGVLHDGLKHYCRCNFCDKMTLVNKHHRRFSDKLAGTDKFYCNFCIRNDYYHRFNSNIMVLTYRGIIGYYYYAYYVFPKSPTMYMVDINDYVELHVKAGIQNPIFRYDPETYCWFIDFSKIGKRKMPIECVLHTIIEQLACLNIYENVRNGSPVKLYQKYQQAIMEFYQHRARTNGDKVFAPTLWGCDIPEHCSAGTRAIPVEILQNFLPDNMVDNNYCNRAVQRRF